MLVMPKLTLAWGVAALADASLACLAPLFAIDAEGVKRLVVVSDESGKY